MQDNRIFISYRREDGANDTVRLKERLEQEFGSNCAFIDVHDIGPGSEFDIQINKEVSNCDILLAVIGRRWLELLKLRINDPHDFVREEVSKALLGSTFVIPILLDGAKIPRTEDLPEDLQKLPARNGLNLSTSHDTDLDRLIKAIRLRFEHPLLAQFEAERLKSAFEEQQLVFGDSIIAQKLADISKVGEVKEGESLYSNEDTGKSLFFVLCGSLRLSDGGGLLYDVKPNEVVGEFPMLFPHQPKYVVTATALETSVVARVSVVQFRSIADLHPKLWKNMAKMLARRMRESNEPRRVAKL
jgi:hypothetical protein